MSFTTEVTLPNGKKYTQPTGLFINNEFVAGNDKKIDAIDPYTGKTLCTVESADEKDVDKAVDAAEAAKRGWRDTHPSQRAVLLNKMADLIERDADIIAAIEVSHIPRLFLTVDCRQWQGFHYGPPRRPCGICFLLPLLRWVG